MCGIFGVINKTRLTENSISLASSSLKMMQYRGPDASSFYKNDYIYIGHNRLAIVDLTNNAIQPMISDDRKYILAFNGEIYNYKLLKDNLIKQGLKFNTNSDTEVLLQMFIRFGVDETLNQIDGMYAGIFIDLENDYQFIFRDPLGQKPLYYYSNNGMLLVSSELRPIINYISDKCLLNKNAVYQYVLNGYFNKDMTPVIGINKVLPGHYISFKNKYIIKLKKWWNCKPDNSNLNCNKNAKINFDSEFSKSCKATLESDVPVGVLLSGGVDSTLVAEYSLRYKSNIELTTVCSDDKEYDESEKATIVSKLLEKKGYKFSHNYINFTKDNAVSTINELLENQDEPHGDPGYILSYYLAKNIRNRYKVALTGDGADELFYGYLPFKLCNYLRYINLIPVYYFEKSKKFIDKLLINDGYMALNFKISGIINGIVGGRSININGLLSSLSDKDFLNLTGDNRYRYLIENKKNNCDNMSSHQNMAYYYQENFLPEFICHHTDRAFMLNSIEARSPFLNKQIITFANALPDNFKIKRNKLKLILKDSLMDAGYPSSIFDQKKQGFTFPIARLLKNELKGYLNDLLMDREWHNGIFNNYFIEILIREHIIGKNNNYRILYNLIVLRSWIKRNSMVKIND